MSDDYNPFLDLSKEENTNPFEDQEQEEDFYVQKVSENSVKPTIQVKFSQSIIIYLSN